MSANNTTSDQKIDFNDSVKYLDRDYYTTNYENNIQSEHLEFISLLDRNTYKPEEISDQMEVSCRAFKNYDRQPQKVNAKNCTNICKVHAFPASLSASVQPFLQRNTVPSMQDDLHSLVCENCNNKISCETVKINTIADACHFCHFSNVDSQFTDKHSSTTYCFKRQSIPSFYSKDFSNSSTVLDDRIYSGTNIPKNIESKVKELQINDFFAKSHPNPQPQKNNLYQTLPLQKPLSPNCYLKVDLPEILYDHRTCHKTAASAPRPCRNVSSTHLDLSEVTSACAMCHLENEEK